MSERSKLNELREFIQNPNKDTLLEAKDAYGIWYPAKIIGVKDDKVHVHFCNWSSRYDTWYPLSTDCVRILQKSLANSFNKKSPQQTVVRPPPTPRLSQSFQTSNKTFEPGTYVMAFWRNQYEYLAEVLAHRCRQNEKAEYRIRFIWDNVVEWTAAHKIRKATQFEIDYVLKFCREHGGPGSGKSGSELGPILPGSKSRSSSIIGNTTPEKLATRSQPNRKDFSSSAVVKSLDTSVVTVSSPIDQKANSSHGFDGVEQNGMVYDKTVLQFHEACRRRRELKRQAIETGQQSAQSISLSDGGASIPKSNEPIKQSPADNFDTAPKKSVESGDKPSKISRISDSTSTPKSHTPSSKRLTYRQSGNGSPPSATVKESSCKIVVTANPSLCSPKISKTDSPKCQSESNAEGDESPKFVKQSSVSSSPTTYPCPFCPRILRHSKLLTAHLANYHKDSEKSTKKGPQALSETSPSASVVSTKTDCTETNFATGVDSQNLQLTNQSAVLLVCEPCNTRSVVVDPEPGMIKCPSCLCWMHKACYGHRNDDCANEPFRCNGCLLNTRPARSSRLGESDTQWMYTGSLPWVHTRTPNVTQKLIPELTDLLNWSHKLQPLLHTGWTVFHSTRVPESSPKKPACVMPIASTQSTMIPTDKHQSRQDPPLERSTTDDQVNQLYMEFRASVVDSAQGNQSARQSAPCSLPEDDPSFASSLPESAACWSLTDVADGADPPSIDPALISTHVLTGFLQDLGPNVISELVDLGPEPVSGGSVEPADVVDFLDRNMPVKDPVRAFGDDPSVNVAPLSNAGAETPATRLDPLFSIPDEVTAFQQASAPSCFPLSGHVDPCPPTSAGSLTYLCDEKATVSSISDSGAKQEDCTYDCISSVPTAQCTVVDTLPATSPTNDLPENSLSGSLGHSVLPPTSWSLPSLSSSDANHCTSSVTSTSQDFIEQLSQPPSAAPSESVIPADMVWLPLNKAITKIPQCTYGLPFHPTLPLSSTDAISAGGPASLMYDTSFSLDTIMTDVLTPDALNEAHSNLDYLDEYILAPLERALFVMESQLDVVTEQLAILEQNSGTGSKIDQHSSLSTVDCNSLFSDDSSPFGSSSSFSLSPAGPVSGESPVVGDMASSNGIGLLHHPNRDLVSNLNSEPRTFFNSRHHIKRTARQLYRYTVSRKSHKDPSPHQ